MTELKTLKDFSLNILDMVKVSDLKAEAIKWVKKYGIYNLDEFLNITKEDLESGE